MTNLSKKGIVIKVFYDRGYGFVADMGSAKSCYFHASNLIDPDTFNQIEKGDLLKFIGAESDKGLEAFRIEKIDAEGIG
ncbi:cold-shock protein [Alkalibacter saccharofermentans]|uniref:'Cold-shock' DNA-binding domain-containing protein n=1 Tax=Alkalibacter saccharofermentans DSM 14828 TaxID=1120975 RepID=A0A1M4ZHX6_9FIRM|nr:cold shock domain-containing protein [Alkalibacter saccharofermentans]SHF17575.1 'Cold-shock' DNA-binding domain-containing protein [Alkalibacter saccharofermentans DSM 14828]